MGDIGKRAAQAIRQKAGNDCKYVMELDRLNFSRQLVHNWEHNKGTPSGKILQKMALAGYDVHWILTGERK